MGSVRAWLRIIVGAAVACAVAPGAALQGAPPAERTGRNLAEETRKAAPTRRFVRVYDFEDTDNPDPVPLGWLRAQEDATLVPDEDGRLDKSGNPLMHPRSRRPGFPPHNAAAYDRTRGHSGTSSIRVPVNGGSASIRLQPGELPIFADADYAVTARVRTRGIEHARAFVTARVLDDSLRPIEGSEVRSIPLSDRNARDWASVTLEMPAKFPTAAWLQIDLEVLQARQMRGARNTATHLTLREDLEGAAWFDDVMVYLQPRSVLSTRSECNVAVGDEPLVIEASVRDLGGDPLKAVVRMRDLSGREVAQESFEVDASGAPRAWTPKLPGYGYYAVTLEVLSSVGVGGSGDGAVGEPVRVATASLPVAWTPDPKGGLPGGGGGGAVLDKDLRRFGVVASAEDIGTLPAVAQAVSRLGTRHLSLPIFDPRTKKEEARGALDRDAAAIDALLTLGQELTFSLEKPAAELAQTALFDPDDPAAMLAQPETAWFGYLQPTLDRFGQQVGRYQLGRPGTEDLFWRPTLEQELSAFESALATLVPGPVVTLSWRAELSRPDLARVAVPKPVAPGAPAVGGGSEADKLASLRRQSGPLVDAVLLLYPLGFPSAAAPDVLGPWLEPDERGYAPEVTLLFEGPARDLSSNTGTYGRVREVSRRLIQAWGALPIGTGAKVDESDRLRLAFEPPWVHVEGRAGTLAPDATWGALVHLRTALAGRRVIGEYPCEPGMRCLVVAAGDPAEGDLTRGALIAWNEQADPALSRVEVSALGSDLEVVDIYGNRRALSESEQLAGAGVEVGDLPIFIEHIDPYVAMFVAGIETGGFVELTGAALEHDVIIRNPWPLSITGSLQIRDADAPEGADASRPEWNITPTGIIDFAIGPLETFRLPVEFRFKASQLAGLKRLRILARVTAEREYPLIRRTAAVELGLKDFSLELDAQRVGGGVGGAGGKDMVVVATLTNTGSQARTILLQATTSRFPTQQLQVSDLAPGQTSVKRFVFRGAAGALSGKQVMVSASDLEEAKRLNKSITAP